MAVLRQVVDGDKKNMDWLILEDSDGKQSKFVKRCRIQSDVFHVGVSPAKTLEIIPGPDGQPLLRQAGPGLPKTAVVRFASSSPGGSMGTPVGGSWKGNEDYEYEQELAPATA